MNLYQRRLPPAELRLTDSRSGRLIAEHFAIRDGDRFRYRSAQGALSLPADFAVYTRGRHRQALRTNVGHARRAGITITSYALDDWEPGVGDARRGAISPGPVERWVAFNADGTYAADAILSVDHEVALLHGLVSFVPNARWLLHQAIVERLCGECGLLLTNSEPAYLLSAGNQHFQRLLGYRISRLHLTAVPAPPAAAEPAGLSWSSPQLSCGIAPAPRELDPEPALAVA
jgi:hypothetical protein